MNNKIWIGVLIVLALIVGGYIFYTSTGAVVSAQGESKLTVQPDEASVYLTVEARAANAVDAKNMQADFNDKVLTALIKLGFERKDIQTQGYNIYQEYDYTNNGQVPKDYVATQQLIIKTTNFDKVSEIVDSGVNAGAIVSSINFELSQAKQNEYKAQALREASADGKNKAAATAAGLGKSLGRLVSVSSEQFDYRPYPLYAGATMQDNAKAQSAAVNIAPSDLDVTASVTVSYKVGWF